MRIESLVAGIALGAFFSNPTNQRNAQTMFIRLAGMATDAINKKGLSENANDVPSVAIEQPKN